MNYYHINDTLAIISGPHRVMSTYVKKLTRCGNPELLNLLDYDLVPEVRAELTETQKHGDKVVYADRVEFPAIDKTQEELDAEQLAANNQALQEELHQLEQVNRVTLRLFMTLTDTLISKGTIAATDFSPAERSLYQQVKTLKSQVW